MRYTPVTTRRSEKHVICRLVESSAYAVEYRDDKRAIVDPKTLVESYDLGDRGDGQEYEGDDCCRVSKLHAFLVDWAYMQQNNGYAPDSPRSHDSACRNQLNTIEAVSAIVVIN